MDASLAPTAEVPITATPITTINWFRCSNGVPDLTTLVPYSVNPRYASSHNVLHYTPETLGSEDVVGGPTATFYAWRREAFPRDYVQALEAAGLDAPAVTDKGIVEMKVGQDKFEEDMFYRMEPTVEGDRGIFEDVVAARRYYPGEDGGFDGRINPCEGVPEGDRIKVDVTYELIVQAQGAAEEDGDTD